MNGNGNGKYLPNMFRGHGEAGQKGKCRLSEKENSFKLKIRTPKISYEDFLTAANFAFLHPVMGDVNNCSASFTNNLINWEEQPNLYQSHNCSVKKINVNFVRKEPWEYLARQASFPFKCSKRGGIKIFGSQDTNWKIFGTQDTNWKIFGSPTQD